FGAGLLSKENAAVLPAFVLAGDLAREGRRGIRRSLPTLALMAPAGLAVLAARLAVVPGLPPDSPLISVFGGVDPVTRILTATGVLGRYLWLLLVPLRLSADYSFHQIPLIESVANPLFLASATVLAMLTLGAALLVRRGRMSGLAIFVFLLAIFPVSNIPVSIGTVMGERLLYLPSVGLCLAVPFLWSETRIRERERALRLLAVSTLGVVCLLYSARILTRTGDWKDNFTLFSATVRTSPRSAKAWYNLGVAQDERGEAAAAMSDYRKAVDIKADMAQAHRNLGLDMLAAGRASEALGHLREAARLDPGIADIFSDVGIALDRMGRLEEARKAFEEEISRRPDGPRAHYNLGTVLLEQGRPGEAAEALRRAVSLAPGDPDARIQLGLALSQAGRFDEALASMEKALVLDPGAAGALEDLARSAKAAGRADIAARALQLARGRHGEAGGDGQDVKEK
ncbi:MAG TPA: tetratricopeptide repeat protein, partial [Candidatus Saccharimonadales bacterium]|nr:tetratricopeptide repeat protein [Candidatus Saccharimonadales bacterium]